MNSQEQNFHEFGLLHARLRINRKDIVTIDLPDDVYRRLLRSAEFHRRTLAEEIAHLIMTQFDRDYSKAEFDKLVQEIMQGCAED